MDHDELRSLLSEQHREIMAAKDVQSDLDFAFQVQMQEAMAASISLQPSVPQAQQFHVATDDSEDSSLVQVFAEELMRFEQERKDRELVETEMGRMRDDLNRCIHDQVFARDLLSVPEDQWMRTGEYFHRPYGEGSSAAAAVANVQTFRMYVKGLASHEGGGKMLAGIGVAICVLRNEPIFELRKPLVVGETTGDLMEVKALIEGLNTALTLGVKWVTVYSDSKSLYQNVRGKALPTESNIAALLDQVTLLQRKFTYCDISLVTQKDIKFALKLAWDAILAQVTYPAEASLGKNLIENCPICLEDSDVSKIFSIDNCLHRYCFACMKQHIQVKLLQGKLPKCPHEGCNSVLKTESCRKFLTYELYDLMSQRIKEASIPATDKIYCPYPSCSLLMSRNEILGNATNPFASAQSGARKCMKCGGVFCVNCKVPWHTGMTCYDYKRLNPYACVEDPKLKSLATRNSWRQCVKCNHMVELAEGCYHIYCRCGYEFCYTCGAEWKNKKATCTCPIWDERNIIRY